MSEVTYYGGADWTGKTTRLICGLCAIPIWFHVFRHLRIPPRTCGWLSYVGRSTMVIYTMQIAMLPMIGNLSGLNGMLQLILGSVIAVCWIAMILFSAKIVSYDTLLRQNFIRTKMKPCTL